MTACRSILLLMVAGFLLCAQEKVRSVWDGIYSEAQATQGETTYREACASCHGSKLNGSGNIPPLAGRDFTSSWNGMSVGDLFEKMQSSMPADKPGQLSKEQNAGILAYILQMNKFPAGGAPMPTDVEALNAIRITAAK